MHFREVGVHFYVVWVISLTLGAHCVWWLCWRQETAVEQEFLAKQNNRTWGWKLKRESWTGVQAHADQLGLAEILEE